MYSNLFERAKPKLKPPVHAWKEDMPESSQPQLVPPQLLWLNRKNDTWLEIPRYDKGMTWWLMVPCAVFFLIIMIGMLDFSITTQMEYGGCFMIVMSVLEVFIFSSFIFACLKVYFITPRDQPIRFNKQRQLVYTYKYKRIDAIPWRKWPVTISRYNWADIHGEINYCSDRYRSGYQLWAAVCEPETYNVVHRFQLADGEPAELHQVWSYLCLYMKGEPVPDAPTNKGRPDNWRPRKADKWPEDMEHESTTAPRVGSIAERMSEMLSVSTK